MPADTAMRLIFIKNIEVLLVILQLNGVMRNKNKYINRNVFRGGEHKLKNPKNHGVVMLSMASDYAACILRPVKTQYYCEYADNRSRTSLITRILTASLLCYYLKIVTFFSCRRGKFVIMD
jgi:hypothetical protein